MVQLIKAVLFVHRKGILHHDIKAENIFLRSGGHVVKLGDFGISKVVADGVNQGFASSTEPGQQAEVSDSVNHQ